jgi:hypothetical protein
MRMTEQGMVAEHKKGLCVCAERRNRKGRTRNVNDRTRNGSILITVLISSRDIYTYIELATKHTSQPFTILAINMDPCLPDMVDENVDLKASKNTLIEVLYTTHIGPKYMGINRMT